MNEKFTNNHEHDNDALAQKIGQIAGQTQANGHFASELEEKLRSAHRPQASWFASFKQAAPTLRWVALMVVLAAVLSWSIRTLVPGPQPAADNTPANPDLVTPTPQIDAPIEDPTPEGEGFDFRGAKMYVNIALPDSPAEANVYQAVEMKPATPDYAQALAQQFGINGDVYLTQGQQPNSTAYMVTDGRQQLIVYAENNYTYTSDMVENSRTYNGTEHENAEAIIREYLESHGFNSTLRSVESGTFGGYTFQQLSPDGLPIEFDEYSQPSVRVTLNENGEVLGMTVLMVEFDANGLGSFGIISADDALQMILNDTLSAGKLETMHSSPDETFVPPQVWYHEYADNEPVMIFGNVASSKAADPGKPAIVFINSVQAVGNIGGMEALEYYAFVSATGQFIVEDGVRKFNVDTWDSSIPNAYVFGSTRREGDQIIVANQDGSNTEYELIDPPADLPQEIKYPDSQLIVNGAIVEGKLYWTTMEYYADASNIGGGGGGGGGGLGFYQLNLSGTPIPFPTTAPVEQGYTQAELASFLRHTVTAGDTLASIAATYNVSIDDLKRANNITDENMIGAGWVLSIPGVPGPTRLDGAEGTMQVQMFQKPDGRIRESYTFISKNDQMYFQVQGENLQQLQEVANRPIKLWGAISYDETGNPLLTFEKYEELFPGLQFEILTGTQQNTEIDGLSIVLFTADGTTYIQMQPSGGYPDYSTYADESRVHLEVLRVPGETYAGYPTVRVFNSGPAVNPITGEAMELPSITERPDVYPDPFGNADTYIQPDVIIDSVELVYLTDNPAYRDSENPDAPVGQGYIQPAWHFRGRYLNGDVMDILVQALRQEYLSPDLSPYTPPG